MSMTLEKAQRIVGKWRETGYKAGQALRELGYSDSVSRKKPSDPINRALKVVARHDYEAIIRSDKPVNTLLDLFKLSQGEVIDNYRQIILQDKDLTNKLKAMMPLLAEIGIHFDKKDMGVSNPVLNLTVVKNENV
jgi:hypothetical protein